MAEWAGHMTTQSRGASAQFGLLLKTAIFLMAVVIYGVSAAPAQAQSYAFSNFSVQGNDRIETASIIRFTGISRGETVSAAQLNDAIQKIRDTGLFETVNAVPQGSTLVIQVTENPMINQINFEGNSRLKDAELAAVVQSQSRRAYSPAQAERDVAAITDLYVQKGRINATVTPQIIRLSDNRVNLVFVVTEGGLTEIESIGFVGNRTFSDRRLRGVLETKQAGLLRAVIQRDTYVADRIEFDKQVLTDFYRSRGYVDFVVQSVNVELTRTRDAYLITFNVQEGQRYSFGTVTVSSDLPEIDPTEFQNALRIRAGQTYSPTAVETDISRLERLALQKGLDFVQVDPRVTRDDRNLMLNIDFALVRGPRIFVERIDIEGNNTTLDRVVRNQFRVVEGDPFNPRSIRESAERIRALGYFSNADVQAREGTGPDQVIIDVNVTEAPTGSLSFGANFNSDTGLGLVAGFKEENFLGRGQSLNLQVSTAEANRVFSFDFNEPNLLGRDLSLGFGLNYKSTNNENADYDTKVFRINPSLGFPVSDNGRLTVFYSLKYSEISDVATANPLIIADAALGGIWSNSVGYSYNFDSRRTGLDPKSGVIARFSQEFGFGDTQYIKTTALVAGETKVFNEDVTLRATLEGGLLSYSEGQSRITDRFFLGSNTLRGFKAGGIGPRYNDGAGIDDALGGNAYAVARLEAQFPLGLPEEYGITGGAFVDYGSVWDVGVSDPNILYDDFTGRTVIGLSIFWTTPIGPLRFNFTDSLDAQEFDQPKSFDVTISTTF
jgi:outer membrane protein insertion porin family